MNVYQLLEKDHKEAKQLLEKLHKTSDRSVKTRQTLFIELKEALELHMHLEETLLYPILKEEKETTDIALEAFEEHNIVKVLLSQLDATNETDEEWKAKLTVLKENIEHHVEEEEGEMFKKARKLLSDDDAERIGSAMATEKVKRQAVRS